MGFYLAVWHADDAPTLNEALGFYMNLAEQRATLRWQSDVEAFYGDLCSRYPEIDLWMKRTSTGVRGPALTTNRTVT